MVNKIGLLLIFSILLGSCQKNITKQTEAKQVVASVYNKSLYLSDLEGILPTASNKEDSTLILNAYVDNWVRNTLLMHEAEKNLSQNLDIDKLVKDYRATLILHNYERDLIENELDTVVSKEELATFYQENKENYKLKEPLVRALFMKIPLESEGLNFVDDWWESGKEEDLLSLIEYNDKNGEVYMLNKDDWYEIEKIQHHVPDSLGNLTVLNLQNGFIKTDAFYKYYIRILEEIQIDQPPPMRYIEEKAKKIIVQKRKINLIDTKKQKLYKENINSSNVKIYLK